MSIETYIVDAFTDKAFKGNPAGVCLLQERLDEHQMLSIAKELGLSETAFVLPSENINRFSIRYFSPVMEIPLCGHATMASSKVLFQKFKELDDLQFRTIEELALKIKREGEWIEMEFPVYKTYPQDVPKELLLALGVNDIVNSEFNEETKILLLEIEDSEILQNLKPNFEALYKSHNAINGVLITAISKRDDFDFESRYFWPWSGTNEDPVTGGTHTFLTPYWAKRLEKTKMMSFQCSERSGFMEVQLLTENKCTIRSTAQIVFEGKLLL